MNSLASASSVGIALDIPTVESERKNVIRGSILLPVDGLPEGLAAAEHLAPDTGGESGVHVRVLHVTPFIHRHIGRYLSAEAKRGFIAERAAIAVDPVRSVLERAGLKITCLNQS